MPVRKIPKSYSNATGLIATDKSGDMTGYESRLEYYCQKLIGFNDNVAKYEEQPVKIIYSDSIGKLHSYHPDILVTYREDISLHQWKPLLVEVKCRSNLFDNQKKLKPKIQAGRRYAKEQGLDFSIITDDEILTTYLDNILFLLIFKTISVNEEYTYQLLRTLERLGETTPDSLLFSIVNSTNEKARLLPSLWHLVANRLIGIDLDKPLNMCSSIWSLSSQNMEERNEHLCQVSGGRSRRMRWRALRYYPYFES